MDSNGVSLADIAAVTGNNDGFGGNNALWILALMFLFGMGGFNGGYQPQYATQDFVQNGFNFNDLQDQNRDIINNISSGTAQSVAAINQAQAALTSQLTDVRGMEQSILAKESECCCATLRAIDGINYNAAMNTAAINANTTEQTQKILDAMTANKFEAMQSRINQLELQNAMSGVVKYPNGLTYNAGMSPFCGCNRCG